MKKFLLGLFVILTTGVSNAAIIDYNSEVPGTYKDPETGLVWLKLRLTGYSGYSGFSFSNQTYTIEENLNRRPDFQIATKSQVTQLLSNVFSELSFDSNGNYSYSDSASRNNRSQPLDPISDDANFSNSWNLFTFINNPNRTIRFNRRGSSSSSSRSLRGVYYNEEGGFGAVTITNSRSSSESCSRFLGCYTTSRSVSHAIDFVNSVQSYNSLSDQFEPIGLDSQQSVWMVQRAEEVSEPATMGLLGLALLALSRIRKR